MAHDDGRGIGRGGPGGVGVKGTRSSRRRSANGAVESDIRHSATDFSAIFDDVLPEPSADEADGWPPLSGWIWHRWGGRRIVARAPELLRRLADEIAAVEIGSPATGKAAAASAAARGAAERAASAIEALRTVGGVPMTEVVAASLDDLLAAGGGLVRVGERDLGLSLVATVAALDAGNALAALLLTRELAAAARDPTTAGLPGPDAARDAWRLANYWSRHASRRLSFSQEHLDRLSRHARRLLPSSPIPQPAGLAMVARSLTAAAEALVPAQPQPTRQVLREQIPGGGRERAHIQQEWSSLAAPLPLLGGRPNPAALAERMLERFPHFDAVISRIAGELRTAPPARRFVRLRPLVISGPPGIGKTMFVQSLARALELPFEWIDASSSMDNRLLAGTASGWATAQPCFPVFAIRQKGCANPLILVDRLDRAGGSQRTGDPKRTLEAMINPTTAASYRDECLIAPVDLSAVNWIMCVNSEDALRGPLLANAAVVRVPAPGRQHFDRISASVRMLLAEEAGTHPDALPVLDDEVQEKLRRTFGKSLSPAGLTALYRRVLFDPDLFPAPH